MQSALFGRMTAGRCISDVFLGCSHSVLPYIDIRCTGHRHCNVDVNSLEKVAQPCNKDYKSYLDASYSCVPGQFITCEHSFIIIMVINPTSKRHTAVY